MMINFQCDPDYEECIVTYLDILGFGSHIDEKSAQEVRRILNYFRKQAQPNKLDKEYFDEEDNFANAIVEIISDAIVRIKPTKNGQQIEDLISELIDLLYVQIECVANNILVRGAIVIDYIHLGEKQKGPYFGPGLVRAYEMERKEVIFPRIAVDENIIQRFNCGGNESLRSEDNSKFYEECFMDKLLTEDESGLLFIDYLETDAGNFDDGYNGLIDFLGRHNKLIKSGLEAAHSRDIIRKYNWLKKYHNARIYREMNGVDLDHFWEDEECTMREILEPLVID